MDLAGYRAAVNGIVGIRLTPGTVDQLVNQALRRIGQERDWPWLDLEETGVWPAAETTTLDAEAKAVRSVNVAGVPFPPMSEEEAALPWSARVSKGYSVAARELRVAPQPPAGSEYTIWYIAYENQLTADADEPLIPDAHQDAVVMLACSLAHNRPEGDAGSQQRFYATYTDELQVMKRTASAKRGAQLVRTRQDVP